MAFSWILYVFLSTGPEPIAGFRYHGSCELVRLRVHFEQAGRPAKSVCKRVRRV